jgi:hypothetical protein
MDNHYHLLIKTPAGNLSQIMHHVQQSVCGRNPGSVFEAQGARPGSSRRESAFEKAECGADRKSGRFGVVLGAKAGTASQADSVPSPQRMKLREIGLRYGVGQSAITQASRRIELKAGTDKKLRKMVNRIEKMINM